MRRRLFLHINVHAGFEEAADYEDVQSTKYTLDNEELWTAYKAATESYVTSFEAIRRSAKREHLTEEDMKNYERSEDE